MSAVGGVLFDIGGVVTDSPLHAIARFEREHGIAANAINRIVVDAGDQGAWSRLERGELTVEAFCSAFELDCRRFGVTVSGVRLMEYIASARAPRPRMIEGIRRLRARGLRVGALTNNWRRDDASEDGHPLGQHFDVVVESSVVGLRKPDPRIYELTCRRLDVRPDETVFLDDLGVNLKPARALGMTTIKVVDPDAALRELAGVLDLALV